MAPDPRRWRRWPAVPMGCRPAAPDPGQLILVTGGAGYIGSVLTQRLLDRGYRVRILDRLYWGRGPIGASPRPGRARRGRRARHARHRARWRRRGDPPRGSVERPDRRVRPGGELADERGRHRDARPQLPRPRDVERLVFASSCSLYDGMPPGMHDETCADRAARRIRDFQALRRGGPVFGSSTDGLCPVMLRNGTVYGYSPRMRFDLVVNTFVKDALLRGQLSLHGGGWMWRPLVDVRDVSDAMIAAMEAPAELVRGEIFNVLHSNYQIRELAMLVAGSVQLLGRAVTLKEEPAPRLTRDYECSNAKLAEPPRLPAVPLGGRGDRRHPRLDRRRGQDDALRPALLQHPLARAAQRGDAADRPLPGCPVSTQRALITGGGGQLASDLEALLRGGRPGLRPGPRRPRHHRRRGGRIGLCRVSPHDRVQLRRLPQRGGVRTRGGPGVRGQRPGRQAPGRPLHGGGRPARPPEHQLRV